MNTEALDNNDDLLAYIEQQEEMERLYQKDIENMKAERDRREDLDKEDLDKELDRVYEMDDDLDNTVVQDVQPYNDEEERRKKEKEEEEKRQQNYQWGPTDGLADKGVKDLVASGPQHSGEATTEEQKKAHEERMRELNEQQAQRVRMVAESQKEKGMTL